MIAYGFRIAGRELPPYVEPSAAASLFDQGFDTLEIAARLGCHESDVLKAIDKHRASRMGRAA